jgi:serine/threonine protein kinase
MGEVYEAEDLDLHGRIAIKTIRLELFEKPRSLERFKREVHLAKQVTHANVCRVFDLFRHVQEGSSGTRGDTYYFVSMELLEGETLAERLKRTGRIPPVEALPIVLQIASGLDAAHSAGILHRDLKPGNVILVPGREGESVRAV